MECKVCLHQFHTARFALMNFENKIRVIFKFNWFQWWSVPCKQQHQQATVIRSLTNAKLKMYRRKHARALTNKMNLFCYTFLLGFFSFFHFIRFRKTKCILFMYENHLSNAEDDRKERERARVKKVTLLLTKIQNWFTIAVLCFMHPFYHVSVRHEPVWWALYIYMPFLLLDYRFCIINPLVVWACAQKPAITFVCKVLLRKYIYIYNLSSKLNDCMLFCKMVCVFFVFRVDASKVILSDCLYMK